MLAKAAGKDVRTESYKCHSEFTEEVEKLRQAKIVQDNARAEQQARSTEGREQIRLEREDAMRIDVELPIDQQAVDADAIWHQQQITQLNDSLQGIEEKIAHMETEHKQSYDAAIEGLKEHVLKLKKIMLDAGCADAAGGPASASSAALL